MADGQAVTLAAAPSADGHGFEASWSTGAVANIAGAFDRLCLAPRQVFAAGWAPQSFDVERHLCPIVCSAYSTTVARRIRGSWFVTTHLKRVPSLRWSSLIP